jgi:4-hydroxybenzoate polyprenyltransferase
LDTRSLPDRSGLSRIKLFLALSRTPHGLLDMATPALAGVLCLGKLPPFKVIILGTITAFAGYTAVYALNDVVDYRSDKEKFQGVSPSHSGHDLDAIYVRHPMAQRLLSFRDGLLWATGWALLASLGAYLLNPVCLAVFLAGCILEALYCLMLRISYLRIIVSGAVKTLGGIAAVFAVQPNPSLGFVIVLFLWLFCWEIGGQNVPNDWADLQEDQQIAARTLPLRLGLERAGLLIVGCLALAIAMNMVLFKISPAPLRFPHLLISLLAASYLLLAPAYRLYRTRTSLHAAALFNKASYYPLTMFVVVIISLLL